MKKGILSVALLSLVLITTQAMAAGGKTVRLGHGQTAGSAVDNFAQHLAKAVNERAKGALNVQVFPSSQLGKERDMVAWKLLGAAVTPLDISEVFLGLRQGTVDAQENPLEIIVNQSFYEVQKYVHETAHLYTGFEIVASEKWFKTLSPELQKVVTDAAAEAVAFGNKA